MAKFELKLPKMGESVAFVDESTPRGERDRTVENFKKGKIQVLCNISLFAEGIDAEVCQGIVLNYSTKSLAKFVQTACRAGRPIWNSDYSDWKKENGKYIKEHFVILDMGGNVGRFGFVEDYDSFGIDLSGSRPKMPAPTKVCENCRKIIYASSRKCEFCGWIFPIKEKEDEKQLADEVEFGLMERENAIAIQILGMSTSRLKKAPAEWLRIISVVRNYKIGWIYHVLENRNEFQTPNDKSRWPRLNKYLVTAEKKKGTHQTYLDFKMQYGT